MPSSSHHLKPLLIQLIRHIDVVVVVVFLQELDLELQLLKGIVVLVDVLSLVVEVLSELEELLSDLLSLFVDMLGHIVS